MSILEIRVFMDSPNVNPWLNATGLLTSCIQQVTCCQRQIIQNWDSAHCKHSLDKTPSFRSVPVSPPWEEPCFFPWETPPNLWANGPRHLRGSPDTAKAKGEMMSCPNACASTTDGHDTCPARPPLSNWSNWAHSAPKNNCHRLGSKIFEAQNWD